MIGFWEEAPRKERGKGSDILGGPPSSAKAHQPLVCAENPRAGLWQPQR
jgi:hypothetical protein